MLKFKRSAETIDFCDRCGTVCEAACRSSQVRERAIDQGLRYGPRI